MLESEAKIIGDMLCRVSDKYVLNVCSSEETLWKVKQPYIWEYVMRPLLERGCVLDNLDMKSAPGIDIVNNCTNMKDVEDSSYDVVLFFSGVEHIEEPEKAMNEIFRVLKSGGELYASAPGVYPQHNDPIDTMLRFPERAAWESFLGTRWRVVEYAVTPPERAKPVYNFDEMVYATAILARKLEEN